jgi:3-hydroxyisobutyrate dehydrogenase
MRYGYIGLGHLGGHLAASLIKAGFAVTVHDIDRSRADRHLAMGAVWADSPRELADACDAVMTCLPSPAVSRKVLAGPGGILEGLRPGGTWIEMSTLGREDIMVLAALAAPRGISVLEAPVTGGVHRAATGDITILSGGEKDLFEQHRPALQAMGGEIFHMGPLGSASIIKVITNMLAFIHLVAAGEALMLAKRGGLDLAKSYHAIAASSGNSFVHETESQLILNGSYDVGFTMDLALKDLGFAMKFGEEFRAPLALVSVTQQIFKQAQQAYGGDAWSTQVVKLLEDALKTDLRAPGFPERLGEETP